MTDSGNLQWVFKNGQAVDAAGAIHVAERGLAFGDGVFETMYCCQADIPLWELHWQRLLKGLNHLRIDIQPQAILEHHQAVLACLKQDYCVVKLMVTRGVGGRGYSPAEETASIISIVRPWVSQPAVTKLVDEQEAVTGVSLHLCEERLAEGHSFAGLKTLNQLPYVLATMERDQTVYDEGLLLSQSGCLIEATARNLFLVKEGHLYTPDLSSCGVAGVMRQYIIESVAPGIGLTVEEKKLSLSDLEQADEVFICNSVSGIWPVATCDLGGQLTLSWQQFQVSEKIRHSVANSVYSLRKVS